MNGWERISVILSKLLNKFGKFPTIKQDTYGNEKLFQTVFSFLILLDFISNFTQIDKEIMLKNTISLSCFYPEVYNEMIIIYLNCLQKTWN